MNENINKTYQNENISEQKTNICKLKHMKIFQNENMLKWNYIKMKYDIIKWKRFKIKYIKIKTFQNESILKWK